MITDSFTGADGTDLAAYGPWAQNRGSLILLNNAVRGNSGSHQCYHRTDFVFNDAHYSQSVLSTLGSNSRWIGPVCRASLTPGDETFYLLDTSLNGNTFMILYDGGSPTTLANVSDGTRTSGDILRFEVNLGVLTPLINGVVAAMGAISNSVISSGAAGIGGWGSTTLNLQDDWEGGNLVNPAIDTLDSPVADGSVSNSFSTSGFAQNITSSIIEKPNGDYPISVFDSVNLVSNGDMSDGITGWDDDLINSSLTIVNDALRITTIAGGLTSVRKVLDNLTIGKSYAVECEYVTNGMSSAQFLISVGRSPGASDVGFTFISSPGIGVVNFTATQTTHHYSFSGVGGLLLSEFFEIDNVIINSPFTFDMPDVSLLQVDMLGTPFDSVSHGHEFRAGYLSESASLPIVVNPKTGWSVTEISGAVTTPGSVFEGFILTPVDTDQVYYSSANNTSVAANGVFTTDQSTGLIAMKHFNTVTGFWEPFNVIISSISGGRTGFISGLTNKLVNTIKVP